HPQAPLELLFASMITTRPTEQGRGCEGEECNTRGFRSGSGDKAMACARSIVVNSYDLAGIIDCLSKSSRRSGHVQGAVSIALQNETVGDAGDHVGSHDLPGVVDAAGLGPGSAREIEGNVIIST